MTLRFYCYANEQRSERFIQSFDNKLDEIEQDTFDSLFEQNFCQYL